MMKFVLTIGTIILYSTPGLSYNNFYHSGQASHPHSHWHHGTNLEYDHSRFPEHETQYPVIEYNEPFDVDDMDVPPEITLCQCLRQCYTPREEYPVCGTNHFTYASIEQLICSRECGVDVNLLQRGRCPPKGYYYSKPITPSKKPTEVPKPVTPSTADNKYSPQINNCKRQCFTIASYDPVCGTDYVLYYNSELLRCFRNCGVDIDIMQHGKCPTKGYNYPKPTSLPMKPTGAPKPYQPTEYIPPSTPDNKYSPQINDCRRLCSTISPYDPVCGTDYVLYYNSAILGCARECGIDVAFLQRGSCPAVPLSIGDTVPPDTDDVLSPTTYDDVPTNGDDVPSTTDAVVALITDDVVPPPTNGVIATTGGDISPTGGDIPPPGGEIPPPGGEIPPPGGEIPPPGGDIPPPGVDIPPRGGDVPQPGGDIPTTGGDIPPSGGDIPLTSSDVPPTGGDVPPTGDDISSTGGDMPSNGSGASTNSSDDNITPDISYKIVSSPLVTDDGIKQCILNCRSGVEYYPYTPVCGTNNIQYDNEQHVLCVKRCGIDVNILNAGVCAFGNDIFTESTAPSPISTGSESLPSTTTKLPPELNFDVRIKEEINTNSTK